MAKIFSGRSYLMTPANKTEMMESVMNYFINDSDQSVSSDVETITKVLLESF